MTHTHNIADRLFIPADSQSLLWDMDGVLVDSLKLALEASNRLLAQTFGPEVQVSAAFLRAIFAYHVPEYWRRILAEVAETHGLTDAPNHAEQLIAAYDQARRDSVFPLNPGITEVLTAAREQGLKLAVVSNNPTVEVKTALDKAGIATFFDLIVGNDLAKLEKKPAPDTYLYAAQQLGVDIQQCVVVEDSLIGVAAGLAAGAHTIGVATGGTHAEALTDAGAQQTYTRFVPKSLSMQFGDVRQKRMETPNEFVTHMLEHIAWRLGLSLELHWPNSDWQALGAWFGGEILKLSPSHPLPQGEGSKAPHLSLGEQGEDLSAAALGMIDDGSAEVLIDLNQAANLYLDSVSTLDLAWFLGLRCEQLRDGEPLVLLMQGLAQGLDGRLQVRVCNIEDPHHTWEGVFRAIGISLGRIFTPRPEPVEGRGASTGSATGASTGSATGASTGSATGASTGSTSADLQIRHANLTRAEVYRGTAESHVHVSVDFARAGQHRFQFQAAPSVDLSRLPDVLTRFADAAGIGLEIDFKASVLSSSHVVLEDTALVIGRCLLEILILRMQHWGVNGAGSSVQTAEQFAHQQVRVGLSVEGRKFWRFFAFHQSADTLKQQFLLGQSVLDSLRSEDLDDFLDGLAGGLSASIMVHLQQIPAPEQGWLDVFEHLGMALREAFATNPYRQGVPPGVKATLA
jgi:HAD superfamily hydrolase (TIGR01509 family)